MRSKLFFCVILLLFSSLYSFSPPLAREPVPGAEIYVELEPDDEPIANIQTNNDGEFVFSIPEGIKLPKKGVFSITITPPTKFKGSKARKSLGMEKQTIQVQFNRKDGPKFKFVLIWDEKLKTKSNKGGFAVSGRSNA